MIRLWRGRGHSLKILAWYTYEEGGEDKEGCQIDSHDSFKEELFEVVCAVDNYHDEEGGDVNCHDGIHNTPL